MKQLQLTYKLKRYRPEKNVCSKHYYLFNIRYIDVHDHTRDVSFQIFV